MIEPDAGREAVESVRAALEPERALERPGGFRWWPHALAMDVWAEPARADGACRVVVETPLLAGLDSRGAVFGALARWNAREPGLSSLRLDVERGEASLRAAVLARAGDGGAAARLIAHAALLQAGDAARAADALAIEFPAATLLGSAPAGSVEGAVDATDAYARAAAEGTSNADSMLATLATLSPAPWLRVTRAAHGLDAELACAAEGDAPDGPGARALLRMSARQAHPRLGSGLLTALAPPAELEPVSERAAATAALLNEGEAREWTGFDALGGWCVHAASGLTHVSFVPAAALEPETGARLAWQAGMRARWVRRFLAHVAALRTGRTPTANPLSD